MGKTVEEMFEKLFNPIFQHDLSQSGNQIRETVYNIAHDWFLAGAAHGAEMEREAIKPDLDGLLLDLYPLTIANASMSAGDQRQFAEDVAKHIGRIRQRGEQ